LVVEVGVQVSVAGSYRPPVLRWKGPYPPLTILSFPPHTIMRVPVQTAVWAYRAVGVFTVEVGVHESVTGSYLPPVSSSSLYEPPHTTMRLPVQTAA
jgi:hypothetical protein